MLKVKCIINDSYNRDMKFTSIKVSSFTFDECMTELNKQTDNLYKDSILGGSVSDVITTTHNFTDIVFVKQAYVSK